MATFHSETACPLFSESFILYNYGDLQLSPEVDQPPHFKVPYPISNGDNNIRRACGSCPFQPLHMLRPSFFFVLWYGVIFGLVVSYLFSPLDSVCGPSST